MDLIEKNMARIQATLVIIFEKRNIPVPNMPSELVPFYSRPLAVYFVPLAKEHFLDEACQYAVEQECTQLIVIAGDSVRPGLRVGWRNQLSYRTFLYSELLVDIFQHYLVPNETLLSEEESEQVKKRYMVRDDELPRMCVSDPVAMRLGAERGQVIMVRRGEDEASYRCVI